MKKEILIQLIDQFDAFSRGNTEEQSQSIEAFVAYLNTQYFINDIESRKIAGDKAEDIVALGASTENDIAKHIFFMYRYAKAYIKNALKDSLIQTPEEFSFLIVLLTFDSLSKTELISKNIIEKTTGIEIIKRLLLHKLVIQFDDEYDKRTQRISISEIGRSEIYKILPRMNEVSDLVVGNLDPSEKNTLLYLLRKLDAFHFSKFQRR